MKFRAFSFDPDIARLERTRKSAIQIRFRFPHIRFSPNLAGPRRNQIRLPLQHQKHGRSPCLKLPLFARILFVRIVPSRHRGIEARLGRAHLLQCIANILFHRHLNLLLLYREPPPFGHGYRFSRQRRSVAHRDRYIDAHNRRRKLPAAQRRD